MGGWQHKEKDRGRIVVFFSSLTAVFSLSLSSLFLEQHFPRRFSLVVFVLRYTDVYSLTSSVGVRVKIFLEKNFALEVGLGQEELQGIPCTIYSSLHRISSRNLESPKILK